MMTEVIDFEIKNEYNIWLLVRRPGGDRWEDFRTLRRTQGLIRDGILEWMGKGKEPRWWNGQLDNGVVSGEVNGLATE
jgi:hypothetical protein